MADGAQYIVMKFFVALIALMALVFSGGTGVPQSSAPAPMPTASQTIQQTDHSVQATAAYIKAHHSLPDFYLTKDEAAERGWIPSSGNLEDVAPGMMIGGDVFTNSEHLLPSSPGREMVRGRFRLHRRFAQCQAYLVL